MGIARANAWAGAAFGVWIGWTGPALEHVTGCADAPSPLSVHRPESEFVTYDGHCLTLA